jgi:hypothetical protein
LNLIYKFWFNSIQVECNVIQYFIFEWKLNFHIINDNGSSLVMHNNVEPKFKININNDKNITIKAHFMKFERWL